MRSTRKVRWKRLIALSLLPLISALLSPVGARPGPIVAIFDIEKSGGALSKQSHERLTVYLATQLAKHGYRVVPRGQVHRALRQKKIASYRDCYDRNCQIVVGRELAAQKTLSTHVLQLGDQCVVTLSLYDLATATTDSAADATGDCKVESVMRSIDAAARELTNAGPQQAARVFLASASNDPGIRVSNFGYLQAKVEGKKEPVVMPLRHTAVEAEVVGVMSAVKVTQRFENPHDRPIEAIYVFPLPHRAAVHAMTMRVGIRQIRAVIHKKREARAIYNDAKRRGKTASLLEQERPNLFTQSVANIMPGDSIEVELRYVEELVPDRGRYSFVFPMVVGPRYVNGQVKDPSRVTTPMLRRGRRPGHDISLTLRLDGGLPIRRLRTHTHRVKVSRPDAERAVIALDPTDSIPNRDLVVSYQLTGARPQVTLLTNRDRRGGHFLMMIQPQTRVRPVEVSPKEYVFVVDRSGSMSGRPMQQVKRAMRLCLEAMGPRDRFQIIRFASDATRFAGVPAPPTRHNLARAMSFVDEMSGGGGTEFLPALALALGGSRDPKRSRIVVFMSDGFIGYEAEVLRFIRQRLDGANLFAFGVGSSVNRFLIDGMARIGQGRPYILLGAVNEQRVIRRFFNTVSRPALTGIRVAWGGLQVKEVTPARPPDLFAGKPIVLAGRFDRGGRSTVTVRGFVAGAPFEQRVPVTLPEHAASSSPALSYLWARRRLGELMDRYNTEPESSQDAVEEAATSLALRYNLISKFTSFVAVDRVIRNADGRSPRVKVPLPLPRGVKEYAAPPSRYVASASLSTDQFVPGDPELQIDAPPSAIKVTLIFPTGEVKACTRDPRTDKWVASFLIPQHTPDGIYTIQVLITLRGGQQLSRRVRYQVDGTAPKVDLRLSPSRVSPGASVELRAVPQTLGQDLPGMQDDIGDPTFAARVIQEIKTAVALLPDGRRVELKIQPDGTYAAVFDAPEQPGRYQVVVVIRDHARNKLRRVLWLVVGG